MSKVRLAHLDRSRGRQSARTFHCVSARMLAPLSTPTVWLRGCRREASTMLCGPVSSLRLRQRCDEVAVRLRFRRISDESVANVQHGLDRQAIIPPLVQLLAQMRDM